MKIIYKKNICFFFLWILYLKQMMPVTLISLLWRVQNKNAWLFFLCKFSKLDVRHWVYFLLFGNFKLIQGWFYSEREISYLIWIGILIILGQLWTSLIMQPPYSPPLSSNIFFYTTTNPFFLRMSFNFIFHVDQTRGNPKHVYWAA